MEPGNRPQPSDEGSTLLLSRPPPFVGRHRELAVLLEAFAEAAAGRGCITLLGGEPGIGKSRLADEAAGRARARGARVLWGRCWEAGGAPAYWPWVQPIRSFLRDASPDAARAQLRQEGADLAQMLPELRELLPDLPEPPAADPETARFRLFEAVSVFLRRAAEERPIVLVLDDLHAADTPSLLLLRFLAAHLAESRLLVLGTYRDTEISSEHPLAHALAELRRNAARWLSLGGLAQDEVVSFIALASGIRPSADVAAAVHRETEGNPLFVGELVRLLAAEGRLDRGAEPSRAGLPEGIREVIGRRLAGLSLACADTLRLASVLGREFAVEALQRLAEIPRASLLERLDEAAEGRVVSDVPGALGRLRFAHALIRDALYEQLSPARRVGLHDRAGRVLEEMYRRDPEPHLAELAHHFAEAAAGGAADRAIGYARRAGDRAAALLAYEEAARLYGMALGVMEASGAADPQARGELLLRQGDALLKAGESRRSKEAFLGAAEAARTAGDAGQLGRAALGYGGRFVWERAAGDRRVPALLEEAMERLGDGDPALRARLLARLACALRDEPGMERRERLSREAVDLARREEDASTLAYALGGRYAAVWGPDNTEELLGISEEVLGLAEGSRDPERMLEGRLLRVGALLILGDMPTARAELGRAARLADELRQPLQRWYVACDRTFLALFEGRFEEAERLIPEALAIGERAQDADPRIANQFQRFVLLRELGGLEALEPEIRRSADELPWYPMFRCALANLYAQLGRRDDARRAFEGVAGNGFSSIPRDIQWVFALSLLPEVARFLGDRRRAAELHDLLAPYGRLNIVEKPEVCIGSAARFAGIAAATAGQWDEAERLFEEADAMNERMGARPQVAHTRFDRALMLLERGLPAEHERAVGLLREALGEARALGMTVLAARAEAALTARGLAQPGAPEMPDERPRAAVFRREGEYWSVRFGDDAFRVGDTKGLRYLAELLARPGREVHALDLVTADAGAAVPGGERSLGSPGDAGEILDARARNAYRRRLQELQGELEEAEGWGDAERAARARQEMEFLAAELSGATGLGGRSRRAASPAERARQSVTKAIRGAMRRLRRQSPSLGKHLEATIRTGTFCAYVPDPAIPATWDLST